MIVVLLDQVGDFKVCFRVFRITQSCCSDSCDQHEGRKRPLPSQSGGRAWGAMHGLTERPHQGVASGVLYWVSAACKHEQCGAGGAGWQQNLLFSKEAKQEQKARIDQPP